MPKRKLSNRAIAERLKIDEGTVRNARKLTGENSAVGLTAQNYAVGKRTGRDGKARRMPHPSPCLVDAMVSTPAHASMANRPRSHARGHGRWMIIDDGLLEGRRWAMQMA